MSEHPHGPELREALSGDGYCVWCFNLDERDAAISELDRMADAIRDRDRRIVSGILAMTAWDAHDKRITPPPYGHNCDWCGTCVAIMKQDLRSALAREKGGAE